MLTTIIPETLRPVAHLLTTHCQPLLQWASDYILNQLVEKNRNHPLVRLKTLLDFSELEQVCADYHQLSGGPGRPIEHAVPRLLRTLFLRYWFDASLRRTEDRLRFDMLSRPRAELPRHKWGGSPPAPAAGRAAIRIWPRPLSSNPSTPSFTSYGGNTPLWCKR